MAEAAAIPSGSAAPPGVTVLICTRNGSGTIGPVLEALAADRSDLHREVLLVDNGSTDGIAALAEARWRDLGAPFPMTVLSEPRPGKSFAFFTGVAAAAHELVVMCDDDNLLAPDYLAVAAEVMADPAIAGAGGTGTLETDGPPPPHFYNFAPWFAVGAQVRAPEDVEMDPLDLTSRYPDMALWGAGLVMRRADLARLMRTPGFPVLTGEFKCEDSELCHALALMGGKLVYTPRLRFRHLIGQARLAPDRIARRFEYDGRAAPAMNCYLQLRRNAAESAWKTLTRAGWRALRAGLTSAPVRPVVFGALARCGWRGLMTPVERQVYDIGRRLRSAAAK